MKRITLCADDFAQSPAITDGILELIELGRLQATSCFALSPWWPEAARRLKQGAPCAVGLHFDLTHGFDDEPNRVGWVLGAACAGVIDRSWVRDRLSRQWRAFMREYGQAPAFIDGHQHVHAFPGIREEVVDWLLEHAPHCRVRSLQLAPDTRSSSIKERIVRRAGTGLRHLLESNRLATNTSFAGFRPYGGTFDFGRAMRGWLEQVDDGGLIMCHPGAAAYDASDPIASDRPGELAYLKSEDFARDLQAAGVSLAGMGNVVGR